jgi:hypothetical protein
MEAGGYLGRNRLHFQFQDVCDRSEDGFASMEAFLTVRTGQPASLFGKGSDPAGRESIMGGNMSGSLAHFSISSS